MRGLRHAHVGKRSVGLSLPTDRKGCLFSIAFQRTLRIPDTELVYSLPPSFGEFPVRHAEDYEAALSPETISRGGVIVPVWQAEAIRLEFRNKTSFSGLEFPVAIKVAAGKINAVSGEPWRAGLNRMPQDYVVSPEQIWLDGFAVGKRMVRQFVAMPLGEGYSVEEQMTGRADWGGLQISVTPLKPEVWKVQRAAWERDYVPCLHQAGLGTGGQAKLEIYPDKFKIDDWDVAASARVFVTLVHANDWQAITQEAALDPPPTLADYSKAGLPWFEYYGSDQSTLPGNTNLADIKSVATVFQALKGEPMPHSSDIVTRAIAIGPGAEARAVKTEGSWDN